MAIIIRTIKNFTYGLINSIESHSIPFGASSDSLNWLDLGDSVELRRGMASIQTKISGSGKITGGISIKSRLGVNIRFWSRGRKLFYKRDTDDVGIEIGTNTLPATADGEDIAFAEYVGGLAGDQLFVSSPNSSIYKIMLANPGSITDLSSTTFRGYIGIKRNRMYLWNRKDDRSSPYLSYIDAQNFTTVTNESIGTGDDTEKTFSATLAFKAAGAKRTCFAISGGDEDSVETFTDNGDGTLTGSLGGTGTINYTTGAVSITFITAPTTAKDIRITHQWEDSTDNGVADFSYSATRIAGEGNVFIQGRGGNLQTILSLKDIDYCLHETESYTIELTITDTGAKNFIYRENVGIPNWRAAKATGDGIYLIDTSGDVPKFRLLQYGQASDQVVPLNISDKIDLSDFIFDNGIVEEYQDYILFFGKESGSTFNNRMFTYNRNTKVMKAYDKHDYIVYCVFIHDGVLNAGDAISKNVFELFSGEDEDGAVINNYRISELSNLGMERLKKCKKLIYQGLIGPNQTILFYVEIDNGNFVLVGTQNGNDDNVDRGKKIYVGGPTLGRTTIGGDSSGRTAYNYVKEIKLKLGKFERIKQKWEATKIGFVSVSEYRWHDLRAKQQKIVKKYRS